MKKYLFTFLMCFLGSILYMSISSATTIGLDRIVAIVNDDVITQSELDRQFTDFKKRLVSSGATLPEDVVLQKKVLQWLIEKKLQLQIAENIGMSIDNKELNKALEEMAKENHITLEELYLSVQREGWKVDDFREEIRGEILLQKLHKQEVASRISVGEEEIERFLRAEKEGKENSYHVADILIELSETPSSRELAIMKKQAEKVILQLKEKGADFHQVAITESEGRRALQGGDLGWRTLPELPLAFAERVQSMKAGDVVSEPIRTPNGFHVIKLLDVKRKQAYRETKETEIQRIFIKDSSKSGEKKVDKVLELLKKGTDFHTVAEKYSEDASTAKLGGYIGWVTSQQLDKPISEAISKLAVGEVSQPIALDQGWHIVKVVARRRVPQTTKSEKERIRQLIFQRKLEEEIQSFVTSLRNSAYIKIYNVF